MKILHMIPTYKPAYVYGGPIFSVSLLCENLAQAGHEVRMITTTANGPAELKVPVGKVQNVGGVQTLYFSRWVKDHVQFSPGLLWQFWKNCRRFDAVHIHAWWNVSSMLCVLICWMRGVRPILSPRGMLSDFSFEKSNASPKKLFHQTLGLFLLKKTRLHLTADSEQQETERMNSDSFVLPNFIQTRGGNFSRFPSASSSVFNILFLSRIHPKKNLEGLIEALSKASFDFRLKVAGSGDDEYLTQLKSLAASKGLAAKIEWLGELYDEEKFRHYSTADLFVLPSFNENFANVVIEALSANLPVLVSAQVGLAKYVKDNDLGWICGTDASEIATALEAIFAAKNKRSDIRQRAAGIVERDFSPAALTQRYVAEYEKMRRSVTLVKSQQIPVS
jgi:glycosyltransferase involved in cell wall biosynthesis